MKQHIKGSNNIQIAFSSSPVGRHQECLPQPSAPAAVSWYMRGSWMFIACAGLYYAGFLDRFAAVRDLMGVAGVLLFPGGVLCYLRARIEQETSLLKRAPHAD